MVELLNVSLIIVNILVLLGVVYFSYTIYCYNRANKDWLVVTGALLLMALRSLLSLFVEFGFLGKISEVVQRFDLLLFPLLISICFFWGLKGMKNSFETFSVIQKKAKEVSKEVKK
ncbi:MAG: hypothetical protein ABIH37_04835 [archaeon]